MKIKPPIYGLSEGLASCEQESQTSFSLQNTRPFDISKEKLRFGKRPGTVLAYDNQISEASHPVLFLTSITSTYIKADS